MKSFGVFCDPLWSIYFDYKLVLFMLNLLFYFFNFCLSGTKYGYRCLQQNIRTFYTNKVFQQLFYLGFVCFCKLTINLQPFCWIAGRAVFGGSCSITTPCIFLQEELSIWNALWLLSAKCFMLCKWTTIIC